MIGRVTGGKALPKEIAETKLLSAPMAFRYLSKN